MKTRTISFVVVVIFTLLIGYGCSEVIVDPQVNIDGPGLISDTKAKASESFSRTVNLKSQTSLKVEGTNGSVNVESVSGTNQVSISVEKMVSSDTYQDAQAQLNNITIEIDELTNELLVKTLHPEYSDGRSYTVNYTINVPSHLSVIVRTVNGIINGKVSVPLNGTIDMSLINGSIELEIPKNTSADFSASLVNGIISNQNLTLHNRVTTSKSLLGTLGEGQGMISLKTSNGNIDILGF